MQSHRRCIEQFIAAFERGDNAAQAALIHPEVVLRSPQSLPYGGEWHGLAGWQALRAAIAEVWSDLTLTIERVLGDGQDDCFVVLAQLSARSRHSGQPYHCQVMEKWLWRAGQLVLVEPFYWDTAAVNKLLRSDD